MGPNPMTSVLVRKKTDRHTGKKPHEDKSRDWSVTAGKSRNANDCRKPPKARRHKTDYPSNPPERTNLANTLILIF